MLTIIIMIIIIILLSLLSIMQSIVEISNKYYIVVTKQVAHLN